MPRSEHVGGRPSWDCLACDHPWPCAAAKVELSEEYASDPGALALYLRSCLLAAIDDWAAGTGGSPSELYDRFLGWYSST